MVVPEGKAGGDDRETHPKDSASVRLGLLLQQAINDAGLSPKEAANRAGMKRSTFSGYLSGQRKPRDFLRLLPVFARVTRKSLYYFFDEPEPEGLSHEAKTLGLIYDSIQDPDVRAMLMEGARVNLKIDERDRQRLPA